MAIVKPACNRCQQALAGTWLASLAICALQVAWLLLLVSPTAQAGTATARIAVSVSVQRRAMVRTESLPSELEISAADVKRGYVEVRRAARLIIGNGVPVGFALEVVPAARIFSRVAISTRGEETVTVGSDGGEIAGWSSGSADPLLVDLRFKLLPWIMPGRYGWPLHLEVRLDY